MAALTQAINPRNRAEQIGMAITRGNEVVIDQKFRTENGTFDEFCKLIGIGGAGNVLVENADGEIIPFLAHEPGDFIPVVGARVVAAHTFPNLGALTTTATNLVWYGGI